MDIQPLTLSGKVIRLEPLSQAHVPDLAFFGADKRIWRHMIYGEVTTVDKMLALVQELLRRQEQGTDLPFVVMHQQTERAIGFTRYMDIVPKYRSLEIGGTWYGLDYQGTGVNTDSKYLMLKHAFEGWGCVRVTIKTDPRNIRSQQAIERLGAVREGHLRKHIIKPDGSIRDSIVYSIIDTDWPQVKVKLENRLAEIRLVRK